MLLGAHGAAQSPGAAKALGRSVRGFDQVGWEAERFGIVVAGNLAKFTQPPALAEGASQRRLWLEKSSLAET